VIRDFTIPPLARGEYVALRALGPSGDALDDVEIRVGTQSGNAEYSGGGSAIRREPGSFWVPLPLFPNTLRPAPDLQYFLRVTSPRHGTEEVTLARDNLDVTVQFQDPAELVVTALGYSASGLEGVLDIRLREREPARGRRAFVASVHDLRISSEFKLTADGSKTFASLVPGEYVVEVVAKGTDGRWRPLAQQALQLESGQQALGISLPEVHSLRLRFDRARAGQSYFVRDPATSIIYATASVGEDGSALFDVLPAGTYRIAGSAGTMTVDLGNDTEIDFEADRSRGREAGAGAASARVRNREP
jgi:hypothetical protein